MKSESPGAQLAPGKTKRRTLERLDVMPDGWRVDVGATTAPRGYVVITNGESFFNGRRRSAFLSVEALAAKKEDKHGEEKDGQTDKKNGA